MVSNPLLSSGVWQVLSKQISFAESLGKVVPKLEEPVDILVSINCANL